MSDAKPLEKPVEPSKASPLPDPAKEREKAREVLSARLHRRKRH